MSYHGYIVQPGASGLPPLDGAWGLRRLQASYTGACLRVRRSGDNAEQDIGFTSAGVLDESALTAFVGANSGYVTTLYDQVGSLHATQTIQASQPRLVNAGTIDKPGGTTAPVWDGSNDYLTLGPGSGGNLDSALTGMTWHLDFYASAIGSFPGLLCKGDGDSSSSGSYILYMTTGGTYRWIMYSGGTRSTVLASPAGAVTTAVWTQGTAVWRGLAPLSSGIYLDAVLQASHTSPATTIGTAGHDCLFGSQQGGSNKAAYPFSGAIRTVRLYRRALLASQIQAIARQPR